MIRLKKKSRPEAFRSDRHKLEQNIQQGHLANQHKRSVWKEKLMKFFLMNIKPEKGRKLNRSSLNLHQQRTKYLSPLSQPGCWPPRLKESKWKIKSRSLTKKTGNLDGKTCVLQDRRHKDHVDSRLLQNSILIIVVLSL